MSMNERLKLSRNRWILNFGLLLVLVGLIYYGYRNNPAVTLQMCLNAPLRYDQKEIGVGTEAIVVEVLPDGFLLKEMDRTIRVKGNPQNVDQGDFVRMQAIFHKEGYLELKRLHVVKGRRLRIFISILPALLVLFLLFKTYRFDWRQMLFTERT